MNSLTGVYGGDIQKMANTLIDKGMYSFAGSDCHRIQNLELMQKVLTNKHFERLLSSGKLLNNTL
jgi:tyrosine-protein phosphatase YwqE